MIATRLRLERARAIGDTLAALGIPALIFDATAQVLAVNALIEDQAGPIRWEARDRFALVDPAADVILRRAIVALRARDADTTVCSFAVKSRNGEAAAVAHVVPVRALARDILVSGVGVLVLTPVAPASAPPVELVQSLFDLTPAEARVARQLSAGKSIARIAADAKLSTTTIRNQLRAVLTKTDCRRQAEIVALLGGLSAR